MKATQGDTQKICGKNKMEDLISEILPERKQEMRLHINVKRFIFRNVGKYTEFGQ
jgi:hypothetical protein